MLYLDTFVRIQDKSKCKLSGSVASLLSIPLFGAVASRGDKKDEE